MTAPRPYRSKLQPFEAEIAAMRQKRPPTPYREIVKILKNQHGVFVQLSTLANFVKVHSKGRRTAVASQILGKAVSVMPASRSSLRTGKSRPE